MAKLKDERLGRLIASLVTFIVILSAASASMAFAGPGPLTPLWLANAVGLAILLSSGNSRQHELLMAIFLGNLAASLAFGAPPSIAIIQALLDLLEIASAILMLRVAIGTPVDLRSPVELATFLVIAIFVAPFVSGVVNELLLSYWQQLPRAAAVSQRYFAHAVGLAILTPPLLVVNRIGAQQLFAPGRFREFCILLGAIVAVIVGSWLFSAHLIIFLLLPLLFLAALRTGFVGSTLAVVTVITGVTLITLAGYGPIALHSVALDERILNLQLLAFCCVLTTLPVASVIADRDRLTLVLRASEHAYRLLTDHSNDIIMRLEVDSTIGYVSPASLRVLGIATENLVGARFRDHAHADDWPMIDTAIADLTAGTSDRRFAFRHYCPGSGFVWLEAACRAMSDPVSGEFVGIIAVLRDISRRRDAEDAAAASLAKLVETNRWLLVAEAIARVGRWRIALPGGDLTVSDEIRLLLGVASESAIGLEQVKCAVHPTDRKAVIAAVRKSIRDDAVIDLQCRIVRHDGVVRIAHLLGHAERDDGHVIIGLVGIARDVTLQVDAEADLIAAKEHAEAASASKQAFFAMMSHEIRTPMTGILGTVDLIETADCSLDRSRAVATLRRSAQTLMTILDDVLDDAAIASGKLRLDDAPFNLVEVIGACINTFEATAASKGISIDFTAKRPITVSGDAARVEQILCNFLSNAIKFTPTGKIVIDCVESAAGRYRIAVHDTGIGIDRTTLDRLFEDFVRGDNSTARLFGGTGLGLSICRRLATAMGGAVGAESTPHGGSTFWVELPLAVDVRKRAPLEIAGRKPRVMIVDDNATMRMVTQAHLALLGCDSMGARSGAEALTLLVSQPCDLVLMDCEMPGLDGIATTRLIRQLPGSAASCPVIGFTASLDASQFALFVTAGAQAVLAKPFTQQTLRSSLTAHLPEARPNQEHGAFALA